MVRHLELGDDPELRSRKLRSLIKAGKITLGGYSKGQIYGTLHCPSGKRMKAENRVFFENEAAAIQKGFRPCGHCLPELYKAWKEQQHALKTDKQSKLTSD